MPYSITVCEPSAFCPILVHDREDGMWRCSDPPFSSHVLDSLFRPLSLLQAREWRKRGEITGKSGPATGDTT